MACVRFAPMEVGGLSFDERVAARAARFGLEKKKRPAAAPPSPTPPPKAPGERKKVGEDAISVDETNELREKLGMAPLRGGAPR